jgi:hypothetical protein
MLNSGGQRAVRDNETRRDASARRHSASKTRFDGLLSFYHRKARMFTPLENLHNGTSQTNADRE